VDLPDDPLVSARARLEDTLATLSGNKNDPAMMLAARNAIVALGGLVRFGAGASEMAHAVERTGEAVLRFLDKDPGEALNFPLLDARATALSDVVRQHGDLERLDVEDRQNWVEEAFEVFAARDAADAWQLGAAALMRRFPTGTERSHLERARACCHRDHSVRPGARPGAVGALAVARRCEESRRACAKRPRLRATRAVLGAHHRSVVSCRARLRSR
jgi:hypothetical protein